jgi:hypothetical protein
MGDVDRPAGRLELVLDPDRPPHRLHAGLDFGAELKDEMGKAILVGGDHPLAVDASSRIERAPGSTPIGPIDSDIVHAGSPSAPNSSDQPPF